MTELHWILGAVVLVIHHRQIADHDDTDGKRDTGLLESALMKSKNLYHYGSPKLSMPEIAAAYAYGIARNRAFIDGNKRTALVTRRLFLVLNNVQI